MQEKTLDDIARTNVLKIMKAKNLKSSDVIRKTNFSSSFYKYITGARKISLEKLESISKILDVDYKLLIDKNLVIKTINKIIVQEGEQMTTEVKEWSLMPSIKECLAEYEKQNLGLISDIVKHGCSGGVNGITYYYETTKFHVEHEKEIWDLLYQYAQDSGEKLMDYIAAIPIMKDVGSHAQFVNALVWWAVEVRAQELEDNGYCIRTGSEARC